MVLQQMQVEDLNEDELPQLGQILSMLLQHVPLHSQLLANSTLLQEIIQHLTVHAALRMILRLLFERSEDVDLTLLSACVFQRYSRGATREQWLTDLLYYYSVTMTHSSSARRGNIGLRDIY